MVVGLVVDLVFVPNVIWLELAIKLEFKFSDAGLELNKDELTEVLVTFVELAVLFSAVVVLRFELKLNPDGITEVFAADCAGVVEVLTALLPKLNVGTELVGFATKVVDADDSIPTVFVSKGLLVSLECVDNVLLVLLNEDVPLGRLKVTCFGVDDLPSVSLFNIGTIVVVIGDVLTVVVEVKEFKVA